MAGIVRKDKNIDAALTETMENSNISMISICPRIVSLNNPGKTSRVPVHLFNMSAKVVCIPSKSNICDLQEINVLRPVSINSSTDERTDRVQINQQTVSTEQINDNIHGINLDSTKLSTEEKNRVYEFLSKWQPIWGVQI